MTVNHPENRQPAAGAGKLAVIGMDIIAGGALGLDVFYNAMVTGVAQAQLPQTFAFHLSTGDLAWLGTSPDEASAFSLESALLLKTAARAMQDAGLLPAGGPPLRLGVFVAWGSLLASSASRAAGSVAIPNAFAAERFNSLFSRRAAAFQDLSLKGNPLAVGLLETQRLLDAGQLDAVLLASSVLLADFSPLLQGSGIRLNAGPQRLGFDREVDGWTPGEGAAALVFTRRDAPIAQDRRIYACVDALGYIPRDLPGLKKNFLPTLVSSETIYQACQQALAASGVPASQIGCLEAFASGFTPLDTAEITALARAYRSSDPALICAIGGVQANTGYLFAAHGLAGLVRAALSLYHRTLPAAADWSAPKKAELWAGAPFYVTPEAHTWFSPAGSLRRAALNAIGWDGSSAHAIFSEETVLLEKAAPQPRQNGLLANSPFYLFPVAGNSAAGLLASLELLRQKLEPGAQLYLEARAHYAAFRLLPPAAYVLSIVGQDAAELQREIAAAVRGIPAAIQQAIPWQTPLGSCLAPQPVGRQGGVAFVYPGAFNSYLGLGRDLFLLYPRLHERLAAVTADLGATIHDALLYPRSLEALSKEQLAALEAGLNADPVAMITTGSLMAVLFTLIVRDVFQVKPSAAFGYSLGEIAMLFGTGIWDQADATQARLRASPLFRHRLAGAQNAVRQTWGLPQAQAPTPGEELWSNHFLMAPVEKVSEALADEDRVYLTHVNTPRQVVIGGDPQGCQRVIAALKCTSLKAPFDFALHCAAMRSEYPALVDLHTWPVAATPDARLYTAAGNQPLPLDSDGIAAKISSMLCNCLDFPSLVRQVYADGARVFIELGANANCTKWIDDTLKGSPYLAVSINRKGAPDHISIVRLLARLLSHQVPVDCSLLYEEVSS